MFSIDTANGQYIRIHAAGRLSSGDYDSMEPALEAELARRAVRQAEDDWGGRLFRQAQDRLLRQAQDRRCST
jgi:hypothetical protein